MIENVANALALVKRLRDAAEYTKCYGKPTREGALMYEAAEYIAAMTVQAEPVAWRYTRADGHFFLTPKRCRDGYPEADGWSEEALYAGPTPPAGGSDAE